MAHHTQFDTARPNPTCDVVIGLDFGTSCTKVVLRTPFTFNRAFAVPFGAAAHESSPYLLPSVLWLDADERASLSRIDAGLHLRDIKYHLMKSKPIDAINGGQDGLPHNANAAAVAFLALTLQEIRGWFLNTHATSYGEMTLDWQVNLGLPSADYDDDDLCHRYLQIAAAAWQLSLSSSPIDLPQAAHAYDTVAVDSDDDHDARRGGYLDCGEHESAGLRLIPEVAAEVVGYARSDLRRDGLHVLMDIGATTMDVCSFVLHKKHGDDQYELLTADVQELGAMALYRSRVDEIGSTIIEHADSMWDKCDPVSPIPEDLEEFLPPQDLLQQGLARADNDYGAHCSRMLFQTLVDLRTKRHPHAPCWKEYVPLFLSGGASPMGFYRQAIDQISTKVAGMYKDCGGIERLSLTKPEPLEAEDLGDNAYHRIAVAWGLSYPDTDIGEVTRPTEIDDIGPRTVADHSSRQVTKDQV